MARKKVPLKQSNQNRVRRIVAPRAGQPGEPLTKFTFPVIPKPVFAKAKIKMLHKVDVAKGITMPEAANMTSASGVVTGDRGGYKGARVVRQHPIVPAPPAKNQRVVKAPSPTSGAGVRSPYNAKSRVGKRGNAQRFTGKRMK